MNRVIYMQLPIHVLYTLAFTPQVDGLIMKGGCSAEGQLPRLSIPQKILPSTKNEHWRFVFCFGGLAHENNIIHAR